MNLYKTIKINLALIALSVLSITSLFNTPVKAQDKNEKAVNLKVSPADINEKDLDRLMDSFSSALGVHCDYCHSDPNDNTKKRNDFAADFNPKKLVARTMITMVKTINKDLLTDARKLDSGIGRVECASCHHGSPEVKLLENVLYNTYQKTGLDASLKNYDDLKKQYYGSSTYDFSSRVLLNFASMVLSDGKADDAVAIAEKNIELFPDAAFSYTFIGNVYASQGKKDEAIRQYEKALQIDPNNRGAAQRLRRLKQ